MSRITSGTRAPAASPWWPSSRWCVWPWAPRLWWSCCSLWSSSALPRSSTCSRRRTRSCASAGEQRVIASLQKVEVVNPPLFKPQQGSMNHSKSYRENMNIYSYLVHIFGLYLRLVFFRLIFCYANKVTRDFHGKTMTFLPHKEVSDVETYKRRPSRSPFGVRDVSCGLHAGLSVSRFF